MKFGVRNSAVVTIGFVDGLFIIRAEVVSGGTTIVPLFVISIDVDPTEIVAKLDVSFGPKYWNDTFKLSPVETA